jgi:hypothetical protein
MKTIEEVKYIVTAASEHDVDLWWHINEEGDVRAETGRRKAFDAMAQDKGEPCEKTTS